MYCVCWFDLDPIQGQGQGHGAFELPTTSEAVHAGGDDRSPLAGLSGFTYTLYKGTHISSHTHWPLYAPHASCSFTENIRCIILHRMTCAPLPHLSACKICTLYAQAFRSYSPKIAKLWTPITPTFLVPQHRVNAHKYTLTMAMYRRNFRPLALTDWSLRPFHFYLWNG